MRALLLLAALLLSAPAARADNQDWTQVARGRYLAVVGDCVACHKATEGVAASDYAGGRPIETPFGMINAANITPDVETGIGRWTPDDFAQAMREGRRPDGAHLYPAFPYPWYTRMSRQDMDAIFAFLRTIPPVRHAVNRNTLPFPFRIRAAMIGWNMLFFTPGELRPDPAKSEEWNRGAYLVEGPGHCGVCHTPMNALGGSRSSEAFAGQSLQGWIAPNIGGNEALGVGAWGVDDVVQYLRTGATAWTRASGPMAEVVEYSTSGMTEADLRAIAVYLKDRPPRGPAPPAPLAADAPRMRAGEALYIDNCAACHRRDGAGVAGMIPSLKDNQITVQPGVETLARVVLTGVRSAATDLEPTAPGMPSFGWRLDDQQVADLLSYVRNAWGNAAPEVDVSLVRQQRERLTRGP
ncbi:cytochrome c [Siccirubricoccus sp. KC 17139]|uniref:Cytochrome c n=1 Tax=Siccirubricoccus soli TaxID=2899147 RepID=A0ABT1D312_9PROT|nr:cytochrome c [Siccirubricoccus soli]MCO6415660.1 cytochrome c [Siccirubricoccus soli]MCP2681792.1 cytochrome c [Siccirubricoccus soli]